MLTESGEITYRATQNILHAWGPSNAIVRAVILAFLTTLLSYQATATVIDLAFGTKKFGFAKIRDIQLLLLTRRQSPYAVARSLFRRLPFSQLPHPDARDPPGSLRPGVVIKLLLLLVVAPVVNIAAIFLTLEFDTTLTFREVEFGGIAMAIDINATRTGYMPVSQACVRAPLALGRAETALAEFAICDTPSQSVPLRSPEALVSVEADLGTIIQIVLGLPFSDESLFSVANIVGNDPQVEFGKRYNYRVAHAVTNETAAELANMIMARVRDFCGGGEVVVEKETPSLNGEQKDAFARLTLPCDTPDTPEGREWLRDLVSDVRSKIVFVESDQLRVITEEKSPTKQSEVIFVPADFENFLRRRNTYADIFIMLIFAVAMVLVRMLIRCLTRNDLPRGIGLIVRDELGIPCCDSMLPSKDVVARYSGLAHIGIKHQDDD